MGAVDMNQLVGPTLPAPQGPESDDAAARADGPAAAPAEAPATRYHRVDDQQLAGFGRVATEPRARTSRRGNPYTTVRVAQNVRLVGPEIVTNWFEVVAFGAAAEIANRLVKGQELFFRGTFGQIEETRDGQPPRVTNRVIAEYIRPGRLPRPRDGADEA